MAQILSFTNPATGEQFGQVNMATEEDVTKAVEEMRQNSQRWRHYPVKDRIRILRKLQAFVIDSLDTITETVNKDTGKSRQDALIEVTMTSDRLHQYYRRASQWLSRERVPPGLYVFRRFYTVPKPYGVVAVIAPWNYPFDLAISPLCSALLAGNTGVLKPSEVTGATGLLIEKLIQSVPELSPFVRVLHGDGRVGAALVKAKPDLIFLTGSVETGRKVARAAAEDLTPVLFELGGKDPMIVLEDADIKAAARWGVWSACYNTGQTCVAIERVYVVESIYDDFVREAASQANRLTIGYSPDTENPYHMAPLTFERQKNIIENQLSEALDQGAKVVTGGQVEGLFARPTVVIDVDHNMKLMRDETFGPLMPIMKVKDEDEAIRLANDSHFGLSASVWSRDLKRAERVAHQLQVGTVNINDATTHYPVSLLPFGGVKQSGTARTHGKMEVMQFTQAHSYSLGRPPMAIDLATQMRQPGRYRLGAAILRLAFGVTPRQRVQPIAEELERLSNKRKKPAPAVLAATGIAAGLAVIALGLTKGNFGSAKGKK